VSSFLALSFLFYVVQLIVIFNINFFFFVLMRVTYLSYLRERFVAIFDFRNNLFINYISIDNIDNKRTQSTILILVSLKMLCLLLFC